MDAEITHTSKLLSQYFGLEEATASEEALLQRLSQQVEELLNNDFEALLNALYRIDVDEKKFRDALSENTLKEASQAVAKLIFDRVMQKARFRMQYQQRPPEE